MATTKQARLIPKVLENGGNVSKAMREVGYSEAMAKNPQKVTKSKGYQNLLQKYLPDTHLVQKHRAFLDAPRIVRTYKKGDLETEVEETDPGAIKALDMAYKLKGKYTEAGPTNNVLIIQNITGMKIVKE